MKTKESIQMLAVAFCFLGTISHAQITITVLETFNYPGAAANTSTVPWKINDRGDVVGVFIDVDYTRFAFVRFANGTFSPLISEPNDTEGYTQGRGINNSRTISGGYIGSDGQVHGFFRVGGRLTEYDVPGAIGTDVLGINNAGDFVGEYAPIGGLGRPFMSIGGTVTTIHIPGATFGIACQINNANVVVGYYDVAHGFYQDSTGVLHFPIDAPGAVLTFLYGINDQSWIVGKYNNDSGDHGLLLIPPDQFVTFDYGAGEVSFNGINRAGYICGNYRDAGLHLTAGFIAVATRARGDTLGLRWK